MLFLLEERREATLAQLLWGQHRFLGVQQAVAGRAHHHQVLQSRGAFTALVQGHHVVDVDDPFDAEAGLGVEAAHLTRQAPMSITDRILLGGHQLAVAFVSVVQLVEGAAL